MNTKYYPSFDQYLGAARCCDIRVQGPLGPTGPTGPSSIGPRGYTGPTGPAGSQIGPTGPPGPSNIGTDPFTILDSSYVLQPGISWIISNNISAGTETIIDLSTNNSPGRVVTIKNNEAKPVFSSKSNILNLAGDEINNILLPAIIGKWVTIVYNSRSNLWVIMQTN